MGVGMASGSDRAKEAARNSLCSPLLDNNSIAGSKNVLINISAKDINTVSYKECLAVLNYIQSYASYKDEDGKTRQASLIWGASSKPMADDAMEVVVVATGFADGDDISHQIPTPIDIAPVQEDYFEEPKPKVEEEEPQPPVVAQPKGPRIPVISNAPAVLERKSGRYNDIEVNSKTPTYTRKSVEMIVEKGSHSRSKGVMSVGSIDKQPQSGNLFDSLEKK